jgi:hypothetical protein
MAAASKSVEVTNLNYDVFISDPPPQSGLLPNGEPKRFSPVASTLIYGSENAVLTDSRNFLRRVIGKSWSSVAALCYRVLPEDAHRHTQRNPA